MSNTFRIIKLAKPFHKLIVLLSSIVLVTALVQLASSVLIKFIIDEIEKELVSGEGNIDRAYVLLGTMLGLGLVGIILESIGMRVGDYTTGRMGKFLTERFYEKIFTLPQKYFDSKISGKIVNQLSRGIQSLSDFFGAMSNFVLPALVQTVFVILVLGYYNMTIALLAFAIFPVFIYISSYSTKKWGEFQVKKNEIEDTTRGRIFEVIGNIKLVRSFNNKQSEWNFVSKNLTKNVKLYDQQSTTYHLLNFARNFGLELVLVIIIFIAFQQTFTGVITFGTLVLILQLLNQLRRPLFAMSFILERIQQAETGSKEFFEILSLPSTEAFSEPTKIELLKNPTIAFRNVSFEYEDGNEVLKNVTFRFDKKETIALVGHSGAGKTTITNLILKFYEPTKGDILLGDKKYKDRTHEFIRSHISLVFQDSELFSSTVFENVAYGKTDAKEKEVIEALKQANAWEFVSKLPKKMYAEIGERGVKLSGGQKQRVQIARAILHNTPILILDEATSSLDAKSERLVQEALEKLMKNKLTLIIAHRFSTIQNADRILVIDDGKIVDSGAPGALATRKGIYSELLRYQIEGNQKLLSEYGLV
ncbi:ABC transporter ATP-binding protein [Candidatus Roizmanbacteria bacterium]|nr:ABC transporter ATP-binding protein [Candidatus Roizmanbacteria bacterium]